MDHQLSKPIEILLVEDNPGDAKLAIMALKSSKVTNTIHHVRDGVEAMEFLLGKGKFIDSPRPDLILLDLNLPRKDGREVLADIKSDEGLKRIPVVVLTVSSSEEDILKSYGLHANCYISKPLDLQEFINVIKQIENFWLTVVKLPDGN